MHFNISSLEEVRGSLVGEPRDTQIQAMIGVIPGYSSDGGFTPEAVNDATKRAVSIIERMYESTKAMNSSIRHASDISENITVTPAIAVYPQAFGAPKGGEPGVCVSYLRRDGNDTTESRAIDQAFVRDVLAELGQSTGTIEFRHGAQGRSEQTDTVYVQNAYKKDDQGKDIRDPAHIIETTNSPSKDMARFEMSLVGDMKQAALTIQEYLESISGPVWPTGYIALQEGGRLTFCGTETVFVPSKESFIDAVDKMYVALHDKGLLEKQSYSLNGGERTVTQEKESLLAMIARVSGTPGSGGNNRNPEQDKADRGL